MGKPDPERTEIIKAFVVLRGNTAPSDALAEELRQLVRERLSAHAYPREISFETELPKNPAKCYVTSFASGPDSNFARVQHVARPPVPLAAQPPPELSQREYQVPRATWRTF